MVTLHLVRHAPPRMDRSTPPWEWTLAPAAPEQVRRLRDANVLPRGACWVSSSEPKAVSTAGLLTGSVDRLDDDLREAGRDPSFRPHEEFRELVLASFADVDDPAAEGWEPLAVTQARVARAAMRALREAAGRDVVLVGHGTALTMLVAALTGDPPDVASWRAMWMPDHCAIAWPAAELPPRCDIAAGWGAWAT